jgi:hypothetical protein
MCSVQRQAKIDVEERVLGAQIAQATPGSPPPSTSLPRKRNATSATYPGQLSAPPSPSHPSTAASTCTSSELSNTYRSGGSMTTSRTPPADGSSSSPPSLLSPCEQGAHETTRRRHSGTNHRTERACPRPCGTGILWRNGFSDRTAQVLKV